MATGIEVYDGSGNVNVSMTGNLCHLLGSFSVSGTSSGSKSISISTGYTLFFYVYTDASGTFGNNRINAYSSGNIIYWDGSGSSNNVSTTIYYGEY